MDHDKKIIRDTVIEVLAARAASSPPDCYRATENRLYAYPVLKENLKRYELDIEDLKREKVTGKSRDITCWMGNSGIRLTPEEKQQGKIIAVEIKKARDAAEVAAIDTALARLEPDSADLIRQAYFLSTPLDKIAEGLGVALRTVQRKRSITLKRLVIMFYGAEALG